MLASWPVKTTVVLSGGILNMTAVPKMEDTRTSWAVRISIWGKTQSPEIWTRGAHLPLYPPPSAVPACS